MGVESPNRLPVDTSSMPPPEAMLVSSLFLLDRISGKMRERSRIRQANEAVIRDALDYEPPFSMDIRALTADLRRHLLREGIFSPSPKEPVDRQSRINGELTEKGKQVIFSQNGVSMAREVSKIVHPDKADNIASRIFRQSSTRILGEAVSSSNSGNSQEAAEVFIETLPQYYLEKIKSLLAEGLSFPQIVQLEPDLPSKIQIIIYLAINGEEISPITTPEEARKKAEEIKRKADARARIKGFGIILGLMDDFLPFCERERQALTPYYQRFARSTLDAARYLIRADEYMVKHPETMNQGRPEREKEENEIRRLRSSFERLAYAIIDDGDEVREELLGCHYVLIDLAGASEDFCRVLRRKEPVYV